MPTAILDSVHFRYMVSCTTENRSNFFASTQVPNSVPPHYALSVADMSDRSTMDFIASLRPVCETIFYFLLLGYTIGIHAQYQRSCSRREESSKRRESADAWQTKN